MVVELRALQAVTQRCVFFQLVVSYTVVIPSGTRNQGRWIKSGGSRGYHRWFHVQLGRGTHHPFPLLIGQNVSHCLNSHSVRVCRTQASSVPEKEISKHLTTDRTIYEWFPCSSFVSTLTSFAVWGPFKEIFIVTPVVFHIQISSPWWLT